MTNNIKNNITQSDYIKGKKNRCIYFGNYESYKPMNGIEILKNETLSDYFDRLLNKKSVNLFEYSDNNIKKKDNETLNEYLYRLDEHKNKLISDKYDIILELIKNLSHNDTIKKLTDIDNFFDNYIIKNQYESAKIILKKLNILKKNNLIDNDKINKLTLNDFHTKSNIINLLNYILKKIGYFFLKKKTKNSHLYSIKKIKY